MTSTISSGSPRTLPLAGCPVRGSSDDRPFLEMPDRLHGIPGTYSFRRCEECHITPARKFRMLLHTPHELSAPEYVTKREPPPDPRHCSP